MIENIATKIKYAAKALMILGVFGSFGLFVVVLMEVSLLMGILSLLCGIVSTWILSCLVYGFGELVESSRTRANVCASVCTKKLSANESSENIQGESDRN